jgi:mannose-6-phosphate isomerase-like protein (cupin superfamily)
MAEVKKIARHARPPELVGMPIEEIAKRYVAHFKDRKPDWAAFSDALIDGWRRAQHRFIGNTSQKPDANIIPVGAFTLSIMYVPPGEGNASHTHEAEEVFFVLQGHLNVFFEEEDGRRVEVNLGPWDCVSCPAGVIHGYQNNTVEPVYLQVMLGKGKPDFMGYADQSLYDRRDEHVRRAAQAT